MPLRSQSQTSPPPPLPLSPSSPLPHPTPPTHTFPHPHTTHEPPPSFHTHTPAPSPPLPPPLQELKTDKGPASPGEEGKGEPEAELYASLLAQLTAEWPAHLPLLLEPLRRLTALPKEKRDAGKNKVGGRARVGVSWGDVGARVCWREGDR
jgi:hypothetical protein